MRQARTAELSLEVSLVGADPGRPARGMGEVEEYDGYSTRRHFIDQASGAPLAIDVVSVLRLHRISWSCDHRAAAPV